MAGKKYGIPLAFDSISRDLCISRLRRRNLYDNNIRPSNAQRSGGGGEVRTMVHAFVHHAD